MEDVAADQFGFQPVRHVAVPCCAQFVARLAQKQVRSSHLLVKRIQRAAGPLHGLQRL